jgi:trans-2,3-dihydro-3-hydroxyanthranilate isomerase
VQEVPGSNPGIPTNLSLTMNLFIVDVFAQQKYAGNQLAVVIDESRLSTDAMQAIAAEMNFSETTFVTPEPQRDGSYAMRLFTPARELAFAGHPILGTAWVIREHLVQGRPDSVALNLQVGRVPVTFEESSDGLITWFRAPAMTRGPVCDAARMAGALGLDAADLGAPVQQVAASTAAMIVPLNSLAALRRARLNLDAYQSLLSEGFPPLVYLWCRETREPGNQLSARFFFEAHGVREDPATGNGAAFLGEYLMAHRPFAAPPYSLRIEQGHEVRRPSIVRLRAGSDGVFVGGGVVPVFAGRLL